MKCTITAVAAILALAGICAGQRPLDDFPIVEKQYRDGSRSLFYLYSPYGFVAMWEDGRASFYVYDKGRTNITMTTDLRTFIGMLSKIPDGSEVDWVNTCAAPLHYLMPKGMVSEIEEALRKKRFRLAGTEDNHFILCTCDTTNLVFFTNALPAVSANRVGGGISPISANLTN